MTSVFDVDQMFYDLVNSIQPKPNFYALQTARGGCATRILDGHGGNTIIHPILNLEYEVFDRVAWCGSANDPGLVLELKVKRVNKLLRVQGGYARTNSALPEYNAIGITGQAKPHTETIMLAYDVYELADKFGRVIERLFEPATA